MSYVNDKTVQGMENRYLGKVYHGIKVLKFLTRTDLASGRSSWRILARCVCGKEYQTALNTVRNNPHPSCGCLSGRYSKKNTATWRRLYAADADVKERVERCRQREEEAELQRSRYICEGAVVDSVSLSERRLIAIWQQFDQSRCCAAWQRIPDRFVEWALRNGWVRGKRLVRDSEDALWHPSHVHWEAE